MQQTLIGTAPHVVVVASVVLAVLAFGVDATLPGGAKLRVGGLLPFLRNTINRRRSPQMPQDLTRQQTTALCILSGANEMSGRETHKILAERFDRPTTNSSFHMLMERMRAQGWVRRRKVARLVNSQRVWEVHYTITNEGRAALVEHLSFYARLNGLLLTGRGEPA